MLDASADLFLLSYWPFAKEHGPHLVFVENLIEAREDLREKSEILETIKERVEDEGITDRKSFSFIMPELRLMRGQLQHRQSWPG